MPFDFKKMKSQDTDWDKMLAKYKYNKGLITRIHTYIILLSNEKTIHITKGRK